MIIDILAVAFLCVASYVLGRLHNDDKDDLQHLIDVERLKRQAEGDRRSGDDKTETAPVTDGCYNLRERER